MPSDVYRDSCRDSYRDFYRGEVPLSSGPDRARRQARMLADVLRDVTGPACVLDVGCGDGAATAEAVRVNPGHRVVGLDWSPDSVSRALRHGLPMVRWVRASVEAPGLPVRSAVADVVIMSELIEHLVDPDTALDEAFRVLKPGGTLLVSTPNLAAWYNRGLLALGVQPVFSEVSLRGVYGRPGNQVAGHLRMFTRRALTGLLAARGFGEIVVTGARYHDVPRPLRPLDQLFCAWPGAASILLARARRVLIGRTCYILTMPLANGQRHSLPCSNRV
jgi:SAM-dependent methyltransferase